MRRIVSLRHSFLPLLVLGFAVVLAGEEAPATRERADAAFEKKNYADAARLYEELLAGQPAATEVPELSQRVVTCRLRLQQFEQAVTAGEAFLGRVTGSPWEPRAERLLGNLWLAMPHWGTRAGGEFHRAQWMQGIRLRMERHDKVQAVAHLE